MYVGGGLGGGWQYVVKEQPFVCVCNDSDFSSIF